MLQVDQLINTLFNNLENSCGHQLMARSHCSDKIKSALFDGRPVKISMNTAKNINHFEMMLSGHSIKMLCNIILLSLRLCFSRTKTSRAAVMSVTVTALTSIPT